jgi:hypothetical protein
MRDSPKEPFVPCRLCLAPDGTAIKRNRAREGRQARKRASPPHIKVREGPSLAPSAPAFFDDVQQRKHLSRQIFRKARPMRARRCCGRDRPADILEAETDSTAATPKADALVCARKLRRETYRAKVGSVLFQARFSFLPESGGFFKSSR